MALSDAEQLVRLCGAGMVLCVGGNDDTLARQLREKGAAVHNADTLPDLGGWDEASGARYDCLLVEASAMLESGTLDTSFAALRRLGARWIVLRFSEYRDMLRHSREVGMRSVWEGAALAAGYRRAPQAVSVAAYTLENQDPLVPALLAFESIPDGARAPFVSAGAPLADMARRSGARADAWLTRYALAATMVRSGDTVLDCGCGLGAGSAILAAQSSGARFVGVAAGAQEAAYAAASYGAQYGIEFVAAGAAELAFLDDDSVDLVVAFDVLSQMQDSAPFLAEALRVLRPDGRIIVSVPNRTAARAVGQVHAFDYPTLRATLGACFLLEERYAQSSGGDKLKDANRALARLALDDAPERSEWLILVGSVDPLSKPPARPYQCATGEPGSLFDLGAHYRNPWLHRAMVQVGERVRERAVLTDLAARALGEMPADSADYGAALTVLAYAMTDKPASVLVDDLLGLVDVYLAVDSVNPHIMRWQISSAYIAGRLAMARGERELAAAYLAGVAQADFMAIGPLLATKTIASSFHLGAMALADADLVRAGRHFGDGVAACRRALTADDRNAIGDPAAPQPSGFAELAAVADMGAQCAMAIRMLPLYGRSPALFWRQVDARRFGSLSSDQGNGAPRRRQRARGR